MAYNNGFPMGYNYMYPNTVQQPVQPVQPIVQQPNYTPPTDNGILWVQGEAGAKSWAVAPGKSVLLMDSEANKFYIKSSDGSGMPMPLRIFNYTEQTETSEEKKIDTSEFVTKDELNEKLEEKLKDFFIIKKEEKK